MILPTQNINEEKTKDATWYIPTMEYYINIALNATDVEETKTFLNAANGEIADSEYEYILKPFGDDTDEVLSGGKLPGKVRNFNLITNIKEKQLGEYIQLPYNYHIKTDSPDAVLLRDAQLKQEVYLALQKKLMLMLQDKQQQAEQIDIENFVQEYIEDWQRDIAIKGQDRLELHLDEINFDILRINAFYNWWTTESFYTHREIINNKVETKLISPLEGYPIYNGEDFVEDMFGFLHRRTITYDEFFRHYRNRFDVKARGVLDKLFDQHNSNLPMTIPYQMFTSAFPTSSNKFTNNASNVLFSNNKITMDKLTWKYYKEVKFLLYTDALGQTQEMEVDASYEFDEAHGDISIASDYLQTVITGYRFNGNSGDYMYTIPEEELVQRRDENNKNKVKLPYGGKYALHTNIKRNPIPNRVIPHEVLIRAFTYALEQTIAKHRGDILLIPKSALTDGEGGDPNAKLFMMKADNSFIYDNDKVDINTVMNGFRVVGNPNLQNYIIELINLIDKVKRDAYDLANMNQERMGNASQYSTVRGSNANLVQAKTGSALSIYMFHKALERDHNADLEYTKLAWIDGKQGYYQDKKTGLFKEVTVDGLEHADCKYGVYVVDAIKEDGRMKEYKELAFAASQNGDFDLASKAIANDSSLELAKYIDEFQEKRDAFEKQKAQQQNEAIKYAADMTAKTEKDKATNETNNILIHEQAETAREKMRIQSQITGKLVDTAVDELPQPQIDNSIKEREIDSKERMNAENNQVKRETNASNERVAKENKP